jgi:hypothetical protein
MEGSGYVICDPSYCCSHYPAARRARQPFLVSAERRGRAQCHEALRFDAFAYQHDSDPDSGEAYFAWRAKSFSSMWRGWQKYLSLIASLAYALRVF